MRSSPNSSTAHAGGGEGVGGAGPARHPFAHEQMDAEQASSLSVGLGLSYHQQTREMILTFACVLVGEIVSGMATRASIVPHACWLEAPNLFALCSAPAGRSSMSVSVCVRVCVGACVAVITIHVLCRAARLTYWIQPYCPRIRRSGICRRCHRPPPGLRSDRPIARPRGSHRPNSYVRGLFQIRFIIL